MEKLVLLGGGGHCKSIIDSINVSKEYKIVGIIDSNIKKGTLVKNIEVIGDDSHFSRLL